GKTARRERGAMIEWPHADTVMRRPIAGVAAAVLLLVASHSHAGVRDFLKKSKKVIDRGKKTVDENREWIDRGKDAVEVAQAFTISDEKEVRIGSQLHPRVLAQMGGEYRNEKLESYIGRIGRGLAKRSGRSGLPYRFTVVDNSQINAFAIPGGYVYVTRGILGALRDEAELAAVLGHEIGHVVGRHGVEQMRKTILAQKAAKYVGEFDVKHLDDRTLTKLTSTFGTLYIKGYGRKNEFEADRLGLRMANDEGYHPGGMIGVFQKLQKMHSRKKRNVLDKLMASHPPIEKRIDRAREETAGLGRRGERVNRKRYQAMKDLLR
ncbi:M48 family metalloprotease, partial [Elusimicrobiota bacterium]